MATDTRFESLADSLSVAAHKIPDRVAVVDVESDGDTFRCRTMTYGELIRDAQRLASSLIDSYPSGSRILVTHVTGRGFTTVFVACLIAGMIAVPSPPPGINRRQSKRLAGIVRHCRAVAVMCEGYQEAEVTAFLADHNLLGIDSLVPSTDLSSDGTFPLGPVSVVPDSPAYLQYTSGSTGEPKGVIVTHRNMVENADHLAARTGATTGARCGGWLPLFHDFGLVGQIVMPLRLGGTSVLMTPSLFLRRPDRWLAAIDQFDVQVSGSPSFGFDLCVRKVTDDQIAALDLSRWQVAINGAEPVQASVLQAFLDRFARAGLRPETMSPGYGLAEVTLCVTAQSGTQAPIVMRVDRDALAAGAFRPSTGVDAGSLVACGPFGPDVGQIVDPVTGARLRAGEIGEIWARGPGLSPGYWKNAAATDAVFGAITASGESGYLRTGDLGCTWDGQLYVTGRVKEVLIVNGRNLYPQDLEAAAKSSHPCLANGVGAAFAVRTEDGGEEIAVALECRPAMIGPEGFQAVVAAIRKAVRAEFSVALPTVVLVRSGGIDRTTSGKIQRTSVGKAFAMGQLQALHKSVSPAAARVRAAHRQPAGAAS